MKFRDPETGEVYDADDALDSVFECNCCNPGTCPIGKEAFISGYSCADYTESHPHGAARLMGYEVVEDDMPEPEKHKEEANVDKPRIAQVLGVEVDEEFTIVENQYFIDKSGDMWCVTKNGEKLKCGTAICCAINHPDRIIRKPRFSGQEGGEGEGY